MKYYFFPLTSKESRKGNITGYPLVFNNPDRLIENDDLIEVNTYDKGTTTIVYNDVVYRIYKDYVDITNHRRIYIGKPLEIGCEIM